MNQDKKIGNLNSEIVQLAYSASELREQICDVGNRTIELYEEIASQKQEIANLNVKTSELLKYTTEQQETNSMLLQVNAMFESRILELEMQMRELSSGPCSPCS